MQIQLKTLEFMGNSAVSTRHAHDPTPLVPAWDVEREARGKWPVNDREANWR